MIFFFQTDEIKCGTRLISLFFDEFTNWTAFFEAVDIRLPNRPFIYDFFRLMQYVINQIRKNADSNELLLRSNAHSAIEFLQEIDRHQNVHVYASINLMILTADHKLEQIDSVRFF